MLAIGWQKEVKCTANILKRGWLQESHDKKRRWQPRNDCDGWVIFKIII